MQNLVEETISSKQVYAGVLLNVKCDVSRLPDSETATREWIDHPGASAVVPLFDNGDTVLVRQYRYATRMTFLEVPAGKLDVPGEQPGEVARRELREETGLIAGSIDAIGSFYPCIGYSNEVIHCFVATNLSEGSTELSHGEFIEVVRMPFIEAVSQARSGLLLDMKTIAVLVRAADHLGL